MIPFDSEQTFALRSQRVITAAGHAPRPAIIVIRDGKIASVETYDNADVIQGLPPQNIFDSGNHVIMPGIVEAHAHINEPGRTEWEGFETATAAAAAGGITTVIDMPLNSIPPTTTLAGFQAKKEAADGRCQIDYGMWGGVIPGNAHEFESMVRAGVLGFKAFTCPSGVDEFPMATRADLELAMPVLADLGVPLLVHAELESACDANHHGNEAAPLGTTRHYRDYLASRPQSWEVAAIRMVIELARKYGTRVHIVHLSAADALDDIARAKDSGVNLTVETCPHYLTISSEEIADGATWFKCAPPIREASNQRKLWAALKSGLIDCVVSDHSPCTPKLKLMEEGDFGHAWGGIAGLQFSLSTVWTEARRTGHQITDLVGWMSDRTARLAGLHHRKGALIPGHDADLVIWDPEAQFTLTKDLIRHRHKITPYEGKTLTGAVEATYVRGQLIYQRKGTTPHAEPDAESAPKSERQSNRWGQFLHPLR
jgi:allantoinase